MLASLDLSDPRVRRYAPIVALVVAGVLVLVVPSKTNELLSGTIVATAPTPTSSSTVVTTPTSVAQAPVPAAPSLTAAPAFSSTADAVAPQAAASPTTTAAVAGVAPRTPTTIAAPTGPLRVVKHTWAQTSTRRGTPLEGAPEGTMPVAAISGANERAGYVELEGGDATLTLAVYDGTDAGDHLAESAVIAACPIISAGWEAQDGQSFASAPVHDEATCVAGVRADDGTSWSWDLSGFSDRGTSAGFALVPQPGGGGTWQVTLLPRVAGP